ncbi:uncharacterized protein JCM6883_004067 [Sporobolomyces salmoneus]|uniref:uncharacterized protein n=1 Tax=Sporobolomyces salmoneus TaxID=183962 RepID=UPI00317F3A5F
MLASLLAPYITGRYDLLLVPLSLPSPLVTILLPSLWSDGAPIFLTDQELAESGMGEIPDPGKGRRWVFVQCGEQIGTGVGFGPGRRTFYEAKLEVPFLRHPQAQTLTPFTYKHTLLFSSHLMTFSSSMISGLNSSKVGFKVEEGMYQVEGYYSVKDEGEDSQTNKGETKWSEELVKRCFESWFVGENTGQGATRFQTTLLSPSIPKPSLHLRLHLPTLTSLPLEAVQKLLLGGGGSDNREEEELRRLDDEEGWYDLRGVEGWEMSVRTRMEVKKIEDV